MYNRENSRFYHKKIEAQIQKNKYILKKKELLAQRQEAIEKAV